jgi:hypothetical protein
MAKLMVDQKLLIQRKLGPTALFSNKITHYNGSQSQVQICCRYCSPVITNEICQKEGPSHHFAQWSLGTSAGYRNSFLESHNKEVHVLIHMNVGIDMSDAP